jgi:hypothetical protein
VSWLRGILRRKNRYTNGEFSLRLVPVFRACLQVQYRREGVTYDLSAEHVGRRWGALDIRVPSDLKPGDLTTLLGDLEIGLRAMGREYVITQAEEPVEVDRQEREQAVARLRQMGFEPEVLPDDRVKLKPLLQGKKLHSASDSLEVMTLVQAVHGRRARVQELVRSQGYQRAIQEK